MSDKNYQGAIAMIQKAQKRKVGVTLDPDWYAILQIAQTADETSIKKQYRKLAFLLHPDKNKFSGAEAAFKLIGEAQSLLCDQTKRAQFDQKLKNSMMSQQQRQHPIYPRTGTTVPFTSMNNPHQHQTTQPPSSDAQQTFLTACPFCSVRYRYDIRILKQAIRCQSCREPFIAYPSGGINNQQGNAVHKPPGAKNKKRRRNSGSEKGSFETGSSNPKAGHNRGLNALRRSSRIKQNVSYKKNLSDDDDIARTPDGVRKNGCKNAHEENVEESVRNISTSDGVTSKAAKVSESVDGCCKNANVEESVPKISTSDGVTAKAEKVSEQIPSSPSSTLYPCEHPESEFHFFDADKTEDSFEAGQVWAVYCELDGMPKYYALIKKVVSIPEFKVNIQWLEACTTPNGLLQWLDKRMPTCVGVFSGGEETEFDEIATFSHVLKGAAALEKDKYEIYPREGEVWAIYKNFSSELSPSDLQTCEYDIGKVIKVGGTMKVLVLEKVSDHEMVFKGQTIAGRESVLEIPRRELLRFAHQIPAFELTDEKEGTLRGCLVLDPKAMPVCLINSN